MFFDSLHSLDSVKSKLFDVTLLYPVFGYSFNLPRVSAQLERLMGTNVVHLTDREYMTELRRRINEDFNEMLNKRIENREVCEKSND